MGSRTQNFYNAQMVRMGYAEQAADIQNKYLAREYDAAMAAIPQEFIQRTALIGTADQLADRIPAYAESGVTTLTVSCYGADLEQRMRTLHTLVEAATRAGVQ
jgi:alkanesulfonate monooxygenase SsuD/methylene tetrahydromethanopterin reductase-like flavin-dependent oxidoreductase (luciferase family)